jgi:hypothetical protein
MYFYGLGQTIDFVKKGEDVSIPFFPLIERRSLPKDKGHIQLVWKNSILLMVGNILAPVLVFIFDLGNLP